MRCWRCPVPRTPASGPLGRRCGPGNCRICSNRSMVLQCPAGELADYDALNRWYRGSMIGASTYAAGQCANPLAASGKPRGERGASPRRRPTQLRQASPRKRRPATPSDSLPANRHFVPRRFVRTVEGRFCCSSRVRLQHLGGHPGCRRSEVTEVELVITGMICTACAARVQVKLNKVDGVTATADFLPNGPTPPFRPTSPPRPSRPPVATWAAEQSSPAWIRFGAIG
jgi:hypothetical protein